MRIKRNDLNRLIINDFMSGSLPNGYKKHLNGKFVWELEKEFDGTKVCYIKTSMGEEKIYLRDDDDINYSCKRIQETVENLDAIYKEEELIDKFCSENGWTYSGTQGVKG